MQLILVYTFENFEMPKQTDANKVSKFESPSAWLAVLLLKIANIWLTHYDKSVNTLKLIYHDLSASFLSEVN